MALRKKETRRPCATALMSVGIFTLVALALIMAAEALMENAAMDAKRDPLAAGDRRSAPVSAVASIAKAETPGGVNWEYWAKTNAHIVAWIDIPNTPIDLPVVQASAQDPQFYLTHDALGRWNLCGCPYVDAACGQGIDGAHVVLYGHNMGDQSMFGALVGYRDPQWAQEHARINLFTPEGARTLKVFGARTIAGSAAEKHLDIQSGDDLARYAETVAQACDMRIEDVTLPVKRLYTLCTCSYFFTPADERTLVYAYEEP